ncbi:MAG: DUF47 family protein [Bacilli bacterium]|jgi:predicted phosphate transport protein (TIGR00153 family)|nr:DUF47 family protein [Bacilli bacterium]
MAIFHKKADPFFIQLIEFNTLIVKAAQEYYDLVNNYDDIERRVKAIKQIEHECDDKTHEILTSIHATFVTPIDREDLFSITKGLDDIVDCIEKVAARFIIFNVKKPTKECIEAAELILEATQELKKLFEYLPNSKQNLEMVRKQIIDVNRIENDGDTLHRASLTRLFKDEKDPIEIIKWKHIYEQLEDCIDSCESIANIVQGIVVKYV